jgi:hypothetical protein
MKTAALPLISLLVLASYANAQDEQVAQPNAPMPTDIPPAPPAQPPSAPEVDSNSQVSSAAQPQPPSTGQWVFTTQYGWVWLPYGAQYTYEPTIEGAYPYSYIYYPAYGWTWVVSPWVWGWGPSPYFGYWGPRYFVWYHGPGWHRGGWGNYAFRGGWVPSYGHAPYYRWYGGGYRPGFGFGYRGGYAGGFHGGVSVGGGYRGGGWHGARHR